MDTEYLQLPNFEAWKWDYTEFPLSATIEAQINFCIQAGILAPNTHNTQPWLFNVSGNHLQIFPNLEYRLAQADPHNKMLYISLGCCIANIESAANYGKLSISIQSNPNAIRIDFKRDESASSSALAKVCPFITQRRSNKFPYSLKPVEENILQRFKEIGLENTSIKITSNGSDISEAAIQMGNAINLLAKNRKFARELAKWLKYSDTGDFDGMPAFVAGLNGTEAKAAKFALVHLPNALQMIAKKDVSLIEGSPAIGIVISNGDTITDWVNIGRVYELFTLTATKLGINSTPMHAIVDNPDGRKTLAKIFHLNQREHPHFFFRLGYSITVPQHTPRRGLDRVLI